MVDDAINFNYTETRAGRQNIYGSPSNLKRNVGNPPCSFRSLYNSKKERKNSPIHIIEMVNLKYPFFDIIPIIFLPKYRILIVRFKRSPPKDLETIYTSPKVSKVLAHNK